jgi:hypothetical protein
MSSCPPASSIAKPVALVQASYAAAAHTVTLTPQKKLVLSPPLELQVNGAALRDTLGRPVAARRCGFLIPAVSGKMPAQGGFHARRACIIR